MALSLGNFYEHPFGDFERMGLIPSGARGGLGFGELMEWTPRMDVKETDKDIVIQAELPGVKKEDINVELKDGMLTISGERKHEKKEQGETFRRSERSFGKFVRSMAVPRELTEEQIKAAYKDGVLEVNFPKPRTEGKKQMKQIQIQ